MGDFAKGIKSFKKNMADEPDASMEASTEKPSGNISGPGATTGANQSTTARPS
jgi:sec-independent protein translocase protein TatA